MPNVQMPVEMVDLMSASRAYEANLSVARNARSLALKALTIGK
jgi:flagellar basal-body rod protein FlgC